MPTCQHSNTHQEFYLCHVIHGRACTQFWKNNLWDSCFWGELSMIHFCFSNKTVCANSFKNQNYFLFTSHCPLPLTPYPSLAPLAFLLCINSPDPLPSPLPFLLNLKLAQLTSLYITKAIHCAHILPNWFFLSITVCIFPLKGQAYLTVLGNNEGVPVVNVGDSIKIQPTSFHYQRKQYMQSRQCKEPSTYQLALLPASGPS